LHSPDNGRPAGRPYNQNHRFAGFYEIIIIDPAHFSLATNPKFGKYGRVPSLKNGDRFYLLGG
jgi:hypothetical protein